MFSLVLNSNRRSLSMLPLRVIVVMFSLVPGIEFDECAKIREVSFLPLTDGRTDGRRTDKISAGILG
jgi:hypothetical protein